MNPGQELERLERRLDGEEAKQLDEALATAIDVARGAIRSYLVARGEKPDPGPDADLLEAFRVLARGDPAWNAIRENLRELVYYRNCIAEDRRDALPAEPARMAVRLARHLVLYVKTRCVREGLLERS